VKTLDEIFGTKKKDKKKDKRKPLSSIFKPRVLPEQIVEKPLDPLSPEGFRQSIEKEKEQAMTARILRDDEPEQEVKNSRNIKSIEEIGKILLKNKVEALLAEKQINESIRSTNAAESTYVDRNLLQERTVEDRTPPVTKPPLNQPTVADATKTHTPEFDSIKFPEDNTPQISRRPLAKEVPELELVKSYEKIKSTEPTEERKRSFAEKTARDYPILREITSISSNFLKSFGIPVEQLVPEADIIAGKGSAISKTAGSIAGALTQAMMVSTGVTGVGNKWFTEFAKKSPILYGALTRGTTGILSTAIAQYKDVYSGDITPKQYALDVAQRAIQYASSILPEKYLPVDSGQYLYQAAEGFATQKITDSIRSLIEEGREIEFFSEEDVIGVVMDAFFAHQDIKGVKKAKLEADIEKGLKPKIEEIIKSEIPKPTEEPIKVEEKPEEIEEIVTEPAEQVKEIKVEEPEVVEPEVVEPKKEIKATPEEIKPERDEAFQKVWKAQRNNTDSEKLSASNEIEGVERGTWTFLLEHIGDMIHRISGGNSTSFSSIERGGEFGINEKINKTLRSLRDNGSDVGVTKKNKDAVEYGKRVAEEYAKIPVYNRAQWLAREAEIAMAKFYRWTALSYLEELETMRDNGTLIKEAGKFTGEEYKPEKKLPKKKKASTTIEEIRKHRLELEKELNTTVEDKVDKLLDTEKKPEIETKKAPEKPAITLENVQEQINSYNKASDSGDIKLATQEMNKTLKMIADNKGLVNPEVEKELKQMMEDDIAKLTKKAKAPKPKESDTKVADIKTEATIDKLIEKPKDDILDGWDRRPYGKSGKVFIDDKLANFRINKATDIELLKKNRDKLQYMKDNDELLAGFNRRYMDDDLKSIEERLKQLPLIKEWNSKKDKYIKIPKDMVYDEKTLGLGEKWNEINYRYYNRNISHKENMDILEKDIKEYDSLINKHYKAETKQPESTIKERNKQRKELNKLVKADKVELIGKIDKAIDDLVTKASEKLGQKKEELEKLMKDNPAMNINKKINDIDIPDNISIKIGDTEINVDNEYRALTNLKKMTKVFKPTKLEQEYKIPKAPKTLTTKKELALIERIDKETKKELERLNKISPNLKEIPKVKQLIAKYAESIENLKARIKSERGSISVEKAKGDITNDLKNIGRYIIYKGTKTITEFRKAMRNAIGAGYAKVAKFMEDVFKQLNNESGRIDFDIFAKQKDVEAKKVDAETTKQTKPKSAEQPKPVDEVKITHKETKEAREELGLPAQKLEGRTTRKKVAEEVANNKKKYIDDAVVTSEAIIENKGIMTPAQQEGVRQRYEKNIKEYRKQEKEYLKAVESGDEVEISKADIQQRQMLDEIGKLIKASEISGSEAGRALGMRARKDLIENAISEKGMLTEATRQKEDKLTYEEQKDWVERSRVLQKKYNELKEKFETTRKAEEDALNAEVERRIAAMSESDKKKAGSRKNIKDRNEEILKKMKSLGFAVTGDITGMTIEEIKLVSELAYNYGRLGTGKIDDVIKNVQKHLTKHTKEEILYAMSNKTGRVASKAKTEQAQKLKDLQDVATELADIDNLISKGEKIKAPKGVGYITPQHVKNQRQITNLLEKKLDKLKKIAEGSVTSDNVDKVMKQVQKIEDKIKEAKADLEEARKGNFRKKKPEKVVEKEIQVKKDELADINKQIKDIKDRQKGFDAHKKKVEKLEDDIAKFEKDIEDKKFQFSKQKPSNNNSLVIAELTKKRNKARSEYQKANREWQKEQNKAKIEEKRLKTLETKKSALERRLEAQEYSLERTKRVLESPAIEQVKTDIKELTRELNIRGKIEKIKEGLKTGKLDFLEPQKRAAIERESLIVAQSEFNALQGEARRLMYNMKQRSWMKKSGDLFWRMPRAIMLSGDLAPIFRQGWQQMARRPIKAIKWLGDSYKAAFSEKTFDEQWSRLQTDKDFDFIKNVLGVKLTDPTLAGVAGHEEFYQTDFIKNIPIMRDIVGVSERTYTSFINSVRYGIVKEFMLKNQGADRETLEAFADYVNKATGKGDLKGASSISKLLSSVFIAPKYTVSRFQTMTAIFKHRNIKEVRSEIIKDYLAVGGINLAMIMLPVMFGNATTSFDPKDPEFMKLKFGNTVVSLPGGGMVLPRMIMRMLLTGRPFAEFKEKKDAYEIFGQWAQYKLNPALSGVVELFSGKPVFGYTDVPLYSWSPELFGLSVPYSPTILERMTPIAPKEIKDLWIKGDVSPMLKMLLPLYAIHGGNISVWDRKNKKKTDTQSAVDRLIGE